MKNFINKKLFPLLFCFTTISLFSQNSGIGTLTPTHKLNVIDSSGADPLRLETLKEFQTNDTLFLMTNDSGIVRKMGISQIKKPLKLDTLEFFSGKIDIDGDSIFGIILDTNISTPYTTINLSNLGISEMVNIDTRTLDNLSKHMFTKPSTNDYVKYNYTLNQIEMYHQYGGSITQRIRLDIYYKK